MRPPPPLVPYAALGRPARPHPARVLHAALPGRPKAARGADRGDAQGARKEASFRKMGATRGRRLSSWLTRSMALGVRRSFFHNGGGFAGGDALHLHLGEGQRERLLAARAPCQSRGVKIEVAANLRRGKTERSRTGQRRERRQGFTNHRGATAVHPLGAYGVRCKIVSSFPLFPSVKTNCGF